MPPKKASASKKATSAKKAAAAKRTSSVIVKRITAAKKAAPKKTSATKKTTAAKNVTPKKTTATKKVTTAKKAAPKKATTTKKVTPRKTTAAKKTSSVAVKKTTTAKKGTAQTSPPVVTNVTDSTVKSASDNNGGNRQRILQKGRGVVNPLSGKVDTCHVYEKDNVVYQCTLNQTDISNNNNKYFIIQLLEDDNSSTFFVFRLWGRVGYDGQTKTEVFSNANQAMMAFQSLFYSKTGNNWWNRDNFRKMPGRYELMDIEYGVDVDEEQQASATEKDANDKKKEKVVSALPTELQDLMQLIGCRETMIQVMRELEINTDRLPLGKISKAQIKRAYGLLNELEKEMKKRSPQLVDLTNQFYTLIPHHFGLRRPPLINTKDMLRQKMEMLEALGKLEVAVSVLDAPGREEIHPFDKLYNSLHCEITPIPLDDVDSKRIMEYARNTQGPTHDFHVEVMRVFAIRRQGEDDRYESFKHIGNRQMLWHGSRITNYIGILSQGLRIAPPEAPCTGYMFGKGIYLADVCTKSASYCHPDHETNTGLMLLCEAALGRQSELTQAKYMDEPMPGTNATKGVGTYFPDPLAGEEVDGVLWPKGSIKEERSTTTSLNYPEHIIYDVGQCRMRYLVEMKFHRK